MNFLAIDTGAKYMSVVACAHGQTVKRFLPDCAMRHSVLLMREIETALDELHTAPRELDFFAAVCGPGSFTGIRIGISTVKGFCVALDKPALKVTSFDTLAYAEGKLPLLALVDAGHGHFYACAYNEEKEAVRPAAFCSLDQVEAMRREGFTPVASEQIVEKCRVADPCEGLLRAVLAQSEKTVEPSALAALYLRKSSAEENLD